tara:strand:- start:939 stop:1157 length:219 start_codon:yes stop_codon:yes gene_type:complete
MLAKHYNRDLKNYSMEQLEIDYKNEVAKFSKAYLSGSNWYVGPSFKEYYYTRKFDRRFFGPAAGYALYKIFN